MASAPSADFPVTADTLTMIQGDGSDYYVTALQLNSVNAGGATLDEIVEITWAIPGRPGTFTERVPFTFSWADDAAVALAVTFREIEQMYAL